MGLQLPNRNLYFEYGKCSMSRTILITMISDEESSVLKLNSSIKLCRNVRRFERNGLKKVHAYTTDTAA